MPDKKVSIIIPVYNAAEHLENCLKSVLEQTYKNIEIILVDDGSTDISKEICAHYAQKYSNIKLIEQTNSGPSAARNNGIINATGEFIQFVDSDDTIDKNMTETLVNALEKNVQLAICGFQRIHVKTGKTEKFTNKTNTICNIDELLNVFGFYYEDWLINTVWNKMYITDIIKNYNIRFISDIRMGEDLIFNLDYLKICHNIILIQDVLYNYMVYSSGSLTTSYIQNEFIVQKYLYSYVENFLKESNHYHKINKRSNQLVFFNSVLKCLNNIFDYYKNKDRKLNEIRLLFKDEKVRKLAANIAVYKFSLWKLIYFILIKLRSPRLFSAYSSLKNRIRNRNTETSRTITENTGRHAYLIMAHNNFQVLDKLISLLDDPRNDIYVHLDKKAKNIRTNEFRTKNSGLYFIKKIKIHWGGFSQIKCELLLLKAAYKKNYDYYHLLSGVDLPIKTQDYIHEFFNKNKGKEFIHFDQYQYDTTNNEKIMFYHFLQDTPAYKIKNYIRIKLLNFQKLIGINRIKYIDSEFQKGANWFSISDNFAGYILSKEKWIKKVFKFTRCADEIFIQTLAWNSIYRENLYNKEFNNNYLSCMRYIDWNRGNPYIWRNEDFNKLINSEYLFARKFDYDTDKEIINRIYDFLIQKQIKP